jgi:hypothetical protein
MTIGAVCMCMCLFLCRNTNYVRKGRLVNQAPPYRQYEVSPNWILAGQKRNPYEPQQNL